MESTVFQPSKVARLIRKQRDATTEREQAQKLAANIAIERNAFILALMAEQDVTELVVPVASIQKTVAIASLLEKVREQRSPVPSRWRRLAARWLRVPLPPERECLVFRLKDTAASTPTETETATSPPSEDLAPAGDIGSTSAS